MMRSDTCYLNILAIPLELSISLGFYHLWSCNSFHLPDPEPSQSLQSVYYSFISRYKQEICWKADLTNPIIGDQNISGCQVSVDEAFAREVIHSSSYLTAAT